MAYALTERQKKLYLHRADVYNPLPFKKTDFGDAPVYDYPEQPDYKDVPCFRGTTPDLPNTSVVGRQYDAGAIATMDYFHLPKEVDTMNGSVIQLIAPGHPEDRQWFMVHTESRYKTWRASTNRVYVLRTTKPDGVIGR